MANIYLKRTLLARKSPLPIHTSCPVPRLCLANGQIPKAAAIVLVGLRPAGHRGNPGPDPFLRTPSPIDRRVTDASRSAVARKPRLALGLTGTGRAR